MGPTCTSKKTKKENKKEKGQKMGKRKKIKKKKRKKTKVRSEGGAKQKPQFTFVAMPLRPSQSIPKS